MANFKHIVLFLQQVKLYRLFATYHLGKMDIGSAEMVQKYPDIIMYLLLNNREHYPTQTVALSAVVTTQSECPPSNAQIYTNILNHTAHSIMTPPNTNTDW